MIIGGFFIKTKKLRFTCCFVVLIFTFAIMGNTAIIAAETISSNYLEIVEYDYETKTETISTINLNELNLSNIEKAEMLGENIDNGISPYIPDTMSIGSDEGISTFGYVGAEWLKATKTQYPYCAVVGMILIWREGFAEKIYYGSGFVYGHNTIITAEHCFYNIKDDLGAVDECRIYVDEAVVDGSLLNDPTATFYYPQSWVMSTGFTVSENIDHDWCVVTVAADIGRTTGWLGLNSSICAASSIDVLSVTNAGYEASAGRLMSSSGATYDSTELHTYYSANSCGGMSGGPLYNSDYIALGIITYEIYDADENCIGNFANRITSYI